jgi:hypothetical protein
VPTSPRWREYSFGGGSDKTKRIVTLRNFVVKCGNIQILIEEITERND